MSEVWGLHPVPLLPRSRHEGSARGRLRLLPVPGAGGLRSLRRGRARKGSGKRFLWAFLSTPVLAVKGSAGVGPGRTARGGEGGAGRPGWLGAAAAVRRETAAC